MTKDQVADAKSPTINTLSHRIRVFDITENTHPLSFNTKNNNSELLAFVLENNTGKIEEKFVTS